MRKGIPVSARLPIIRAVVVNGMALDRENLQGTYGMAVRFFCHGQEEKGVIS